MTLPLEHRRYVATLVAAVRARQELPPRIQDPVVLDRVAELIRPVLKNTVEGPTPPDSTAMARRGRAAKRRPSGGVPTNIPGGLGRAVNT